MQEPGENCFTHVPVHISIMAAFMASGQIGAHIIIHARPSLELGRAWGRGCLDVCMFSELYYCIVAIPDDRPVAIKAVITWQRI